MKSKYFQFKIIIDSNISGKRIDNFLSNYMEEEKINFKDLKMVFSRTRIQKFVNEGNILVNDQTVKPSYIVQKKDVIDLKIPMEFGEKVEIKPEHIYFNIVYNDKDLAVINKPAGLVVHPAHGHHNHTLLNGLLYLFPELKKNTNLSRMGMVHRLDKDTSGLLIITKNEVAQHHIIMQYKERTVKKEYAAIVYGKLSNEEGEIETRIGRNPVDRKKMAVLITNGKESITKYKIIKYLSNGTYLKLMPHTGRTHQLRVHMNYIKHPVVGDDIYAGKRKNPNSLGLMLHAKRIKFIHPKTNNAMEFETALPDRFQIILQKGEV